MIQRKMHRNLKTEQLESHGGKRKHSRNVENCCSTGGNRHVTQAKNTVKKHIR